MDGLGQPQGSGWVLFNRDTGGGCGVNLFSNDFCFSDFALFPLPAPRPDTINYSVF